MKTMTHLQALLRTRHGAVLSVLLVGAMAAGTAQAASPAAPTANAASAPASVAEEYTNGEIRKIDAEAGKVTLKHEEIRNLGMPPMAMVFEVKDRAQLSRFKTGDKVRFRAVHQGGKYILTDLEPAR